ncbi:PadR family transcriptional regulator [Ciceribacter lividus]|uniref:PadR family transcriptional regulator n=1 Tax=Ciceribacter lividus TaxID=1197950 RepID=A0A6I7HSB1_9HYPH|nr:helix-turn-helix transcriptional regulator [Ciceribacter lividus]RCW28108.1 PadR family transcriptional regulator [Ciceribacter lividus]
MHDSNQNTVLQSEAEARELGSFELKLLASINKLRDRAWGSNLQADLSQIVGRDVAIGQLYLALSKLEKKGMISADKKDPEPVRGGRSKKVYRLETPGAKALARTVDFLNAPSVLRPQENKHGEFAH